MQQHNKWENCLETHKNVNHLIQLSPNTCMYCGTHFPSRNKLFKHLELMNVDMVRTNQHRKRKKSPLKKKRKKQNVKSMTLILNDLKL